jgi:hypothetical protein
MAGCLSRVSNLPTVVPGMLLSVFDLPWLHFLLSQNDTHTRRSQLPRGIRVLYLPQVRRREEAVDELWCLSWDMVGMGV